MATSAPIASSGGGRHRRPHDLGHDHRRRRLTLRLPVLARPSADRTIEPSPTDRGVPVAHQYLVVANHTLGGQELLDAIGDRISRGPAEFWVLVPATPTPHLVNDLNALSGAFPVDADQLPGAADVRTRDQCIAEAKSNLDPELHHLRQIGATADGAVGDPDPMKAIEKTLALPPSSAGGVCPVDRVLHVPCWPLVGGCPCGV
jgi:hypothetical protein